MPAIELSTSSAVCRRCGKAYSRMRDGFQRSYASLYKGTGYLPYCKDCVDSMFAGYLAACHDDKNSVRQMCRKLDIYWSADLFESVEKKNSSRSIMTSYITAVNAQKYAGRSYDDTLREEDALWVWPSQYGSPGNVKDVESDDDIEISQDVVAFWGTGYTPTMYRDLEQRRSYWMSRYQGDTDIDIGLEALIRQICALELDINRDRADGKSVDKSVSALNNLLGSAMLKPAQKNDSGDTALEKTPFGVWIDRWENKRPIPDPDPELQDVDGIVKYITTWFLGHLCKMLGIKNSYCKLYEDEIAKLRVEHPEFEDEDDETLFNDIFSSSPDDGDSE